MRKAVARRGREGWVRRMRHVVDEDDVKGFWQAATAAQPLLSPAYLLLSCSDRFLGFSVEQAIQEMSRRRSCCQFQVEWKWEIWWKCLRWRRPAENIKMSRYLLAQTRGRMTETRAPENRSVFTVYSITSKRHMRQHRRPDALPRGSACSYIDSWEVALPA